MTVAPKKALGQHFLADANLLGVIDRLAELDAADVVLEIGPGLGVLTRLLADRVAHVHAVELDRSLKPHLTAALGGRQNVELHWGDALALDLGASRPPPDKLVANLPYNVATPVVVESLDGLPSLRRWCVMVQREVADRFFAEPRTKAYGAVSVLVQLATRRTGFHPVARTVFRPPPNVDSALVAFERRGDAGGLAARPHRGRGRVLAPPQDAAELARSCGVRRPAASGRGAGGDRPSARLARRGAVAAGVRRARRGAAVRRAPATAKLNLALVVGPLREDGKHEVVTVLQRLDLADRVAVEPAGSLAVSGFEGDTLVRAALEALAAAAGVEPGWHATDRPSASPWRPVWAAAARTRRRRFAWRTRRCPSRSQTRS